MRTIHSHSPTSRVHTVARAAMVALFLSLALCTACSGPDWTRPDARGIPSALVVRGEALREAIDDQWKHPQSKNRRRYGLDIDDVVLQYIPVGSSYDEALLVLTAAGFKVEDRRMSVTDVGKPWYQPSRIDPYAPCMLCRITAFVALYPGTGEDWSRVGRLHAEISIMYL
jgi:hypothetical protein